MQRFKVAHVYTLQPDCEAKSLALQIKGVYSMQILYDLAAKLMVYCK